MTAVFANIQVRLLRIAEGVRRHWKRIALGAACGWLGSTVLGAFALVALESLNVITSDQAAAFLAAVVGWSGIGIGALVAYAARPA